MIEDRARTAVFRRLASELLAGGYRLRFQAKGRSMMPTIEDGDIVHVAPIAPRKLKAGDIVLFRCGKNFKAHRIIGTRGDFIVTRGDAGIEDDGLVRPGDVLGLVTAKECTASGRTVRLTSMTARSMFAAREIRRRLAMLMRKQEQTTARAQARS